MKLKPRHCCDFAKPRQRRLRLNFLWLIGNKQFRIWLRTNNVNDRASEINDVAPTSLSHIIGQRSVIDQLRVAIDAAFEDGRKLDSCLMVGGPGLGKSALARVISNEMATDFHEVIGQSITSPADLNAFLLTAKEKSVCHIDEAHELKPAFQTALYLALDQRRLFMGGGKSVQSLPIADFTLLLS